MLWKESRREKKGLSANMDKEYFDEIFLGRNGLMESKMADFGFGLKFELIPVFLRKKSEENTFKPSENLFAKKTI